MQARQKNQAKKDKKAQPAVLQPKFDRVAYKLAPPLLPGRIPSVPIQILTLPQLATAGFEELLVLIFSAPIAELLIERLFSGDRQARIEAVLFCLAYMRLGQVPLEMMSTSSVLERFAHLTNESVVVVPHDIRLTSSALAAIQFTDFLMRQTPDKTIEGFKQKVECFIQKAPTLFPLVFEDQPFAAKLNHAIFKEHACCALFMLGQQRGLLDDGLCRKIIALFKQGCSISSFWLYLLTTPLSESVVRHLWRVANANPEANEAFIGEIRNLILASGVFSIKYLRELDGMSSLHLTAPLVPCHVIEVNLGSYLHRLFANEKFSDITFFLAHTAAKKIKNGSRVTDFEGKTLLIAAFKYRTPKVIWGKCFDNRLFDPDPVEVINDSDERGFTALHYAMLFGELEGIVALLERGARTDIKNKQDHSVWDYLHMSQDDFKKLIRAELEKAELLPDRCADLPMNDLRGYVDRNNHRIPIIKEALGSMPRNMVLTLDEDGKKFLSAQLLKNFKTLFQVCCDGIEPAREKLTHHLSQQTSEAAAARARPSHTNPLGAGSFGFFLGGGHARGGAVGSGSEVHSPLGQLPAQQRP